MAFKKLTKNVKVGDYVSCPVGYDYNGYTEYECGQIIRFFKNTKDEDCAEVKVWYHNTGVFTTKKIALKNLRQINFYHCVNEKQMFEKALELEGIQVISYNLEHLRINNRCSDEGYINSVTW